VAVVVELKQTMALMVDLVGVVLLVVLLVVQDSPQEMHCRVISCQPFQDIPWGKVGVVAVALLPLIGMSQIVVEVVGQAKLVLLAHHLDLELVEMEFTVYHGLVVL
jgi:hypothetical protein